MTKSDEILLTELFVISRNRNHFSYLVLKKMNIKLADMSDQERSAKINTLRELYNTLAEDQTIQSIKKTHIQETNKNDKR